MAKSVQLFFGVYPSLNTPFTAQPISVKEKAQLLYSIGSIKNREIRREKITERRDRERLTMCYKNVLFWGNLFYHNQALYFKEVGQPLHPQTHIHTFTHLHTDNRQ